MKDMSTQSPERDWKYFLLCTGFCLLAELMLIANGYWNAINTIIAVGFALTSFVTIYTYKLKQ